MARFSPKDFEELYKRYPRREGKKRGMIRLCATIKTEAEFKAFESAMDTYLAMVVAENRETRFVKHWGTFVNNWTDYLSKEIAIHNINKNITRVQEQVARIMAGKI